jgi:hypothetical protein
MFRPFHRAITAALLFGVVATGCDGGLPAPRNMDEHRDDPTMVFEDHADGITVGEISLGEFCESQAEGAACNDGDSCTFGDRCSEGKCVGAPLKCSSPNENQCASETTLVIEHSTGTCVEGSCVYPTETVLCPNGCDKEKNTCIDDPCASMTCSNPPAAHCEKDTVVLYAASGECTAGQCSYQTTEVPCEFGCASGACLPDPCANGACEDPQPCDYMVCDNAPLTTCNGSALVTYAAEGFCSLGQCDYPSTETTCEFGCASGACLPDPCANGACEDPQPCDYMVCDKAPLTTCNGSALVTYAAEGFCSMGQCDYPSTETACEFGCASGACLPDPCANGACEDPQPCDYMVCDKIPLDTCNGDTLIAYSAAGYCSLGQCNYPSTKTVCEFGCSKGSCLPDPCANGACEDPQPCDYMVCDKIPLDTCNGDTLIAYTAAGYCSLGQCIYPTTKTVCKYGCSKGSCNK